MEQAVEIIDDVDDPFIPGTNIQWAWDSTSLGYLKQCPRLYQYIVIEGWQSKEENIYFRFGREVHTALQQYHHSRANGIDHDNSVFDVIRELIYRIEGWDPYALSEELANYRNRFSLVRAIVDYLDHYEDDQAKTYIKPDGEPAVELSFRVMLEHLLVPVDYEQHYFLCGHIDRIVEYGGQLFVDDYKTTQKTVGSYYFDQYEPHNQMTLYTRAADVLFDTPVKGVMIDAIQLMKGETRCVRSITYRTESQLVEWTEDLFFWFNAAFDYASRNYWPMNDTSCPRCRFREVCSKAPEVRDRFLEAKFVKAERWNPLIPR